MLTKRLIILTLTGTLALAAHADNDLQAADTVHSEYAGRGSILRDYAFIKHQDVWLTSHNAAALTRYASRNIAEAAVGITYEKGGFTDFNGAPESFSFDAGIESFYRISPRTVVYGSMDYDNFSGNDMAGSALMDGRHRPFDLIEMTTDNEGRKHSDTYSLTGAVGVDLWHGTAVGLRLDYTSANYAKYKDLRHKNRLMDMQFTAGFYAPVLPWLSIGADYLYHRNTESVDFSTYGKMEKVYQTLIEYAAFTGRVEQFGNTGFTDKSNELPLVEDRNGIGAQLEARLSDRLSLFGGFTYSHATGYYGMKSPYTVTYTNHHSDSYGYQGRLTLRANRALHYLDVSFSADEMANFIETYQNIDNASGASYYEYYEAVKSADKLWQDFSVGYTANLGIRGELPTWVITAAYSSARRKQTAYMYPYLRRQDLTTYGGSVSVTRNIPVSYGAWAIGLSAAFSQGSGAPCEDVAIVEPSDKQEQPPTMETYLYREYAWLTAPQYTVGCTVKYSYPLPNTAAVVFASAAATHHKANVATAQLRGSDHTVLSLSIGCTF